MKEIMTTAWMVAKEWHWSMSKCLKIARAWFRLRVRMNSEAVIFRYFKIDGTVRTARGTLSLDIIPSHMDGMGSPDRKRSDAVQTYYDLDKNAWRCFRKCNLIL